VTEFKLFSTYSEATEYVKSHLGVGVKRNPNGDGWVVQTSSQNETLAPTPKKQSITNQESTLPSGWSISKNGSYYKRTDLGVFWVVKSRKGGWYLNAQNADLSNGYAFATPMMAMQKGNEIIISKADRYTSFPTPTVPEGRSTPKFPQKILPEPKSPLPPKRDKIIPKKMDVDGIGGTREDAKKMQMRGGS